MLESKKIAVKAIAALAFGALLLSGCGKDEAAPGGPGRPGGPRLNTPGAFGAKAVTPAEANAEKATAIAERKRLEAEVKADTEKRNSLDKNSKAQIAALEASIQKKQTELKFAQTREEDANKLIEEAKVAEAVRVNKAAMAKLQANLQGLGKSIGETKTQAETTHGKHDAEDQAFKARLAALEAQHKSMEQQLAETKKNFEVSSASHKNFMTSRIKRESRQKVEAMETAFRTSQDKLDVAKETLGKKKDEVTKNAVIAAEKELEQLQKQLDTAKEAEKTAEEAAIKAEDELKAIAPAAGA